MSGNFTFPFVSNSSGSAGTVTSVSVTTANGVSGTVATSTVTPAITLTLGAITPTTVQTTAADAAAAYFFGGVTDSFPAFRRNGTTIEAVTGGLGAFVPIKLSYLDVGGAWRLNNTTDPAFVNSGASAYMPLRVDAIRLLGSANTTVDTGIARNAAGVVEVNNGTLGTFRDLLARTLTDSKGEIRLIPQNSQSAAYTTVLADAGKHLLHPSGDANARTFTIDSNANVAYPIGTAITFVNQTANVLSIAITSDTMTLANSTTTGTRSLAQNGIATALKVSTTGWIISGTGLS